MRCVFDPQKDASNIAKHGISLELAQMLFESPHVSVEDDRFDYGERRCVAFGRIAGRMFACVYVHRGSERRVISLRKANTREVGRFEAKI